ncbi:unnamed protein product, partial [marine sediment metagenome]
AVSSSSIFFIILFFSFSYCSKFLFILDKIENIISEIKNQLLILEEEAKHLNSYKICQEEIKNLEL